jgi:glycosyltransferase involved in cell wall biosynthesis
MKLSIVITLLNEEESVSPLLEALVIHLDGLSYEIILVDDGSTG